MNDSMAMCVCMCVCVHVHVCVTSVGNRRVTHQRECVLSVGRHTNWRPVILRTMFPYGFIHQLWRTAAAAPHSRSKEVSHKACHPAVAQRFCIELYAHACSAMQRVQLRRA